ncbi:hypothetical protein ACFQ49_17845 [Kroppenstedtia eburnea]|uniref:hypothetical protein n=1 Tax=Kroppenstedtia eburnea TaxID=714067 RepID=UPI00363465CA
MSNPFRRRVAIVTLLFIGLSLASPFSFTVYADWKIDTPTEVETPTQVEPSAKNPTQTEAEENNKKETSNEDGHSGVSWADAGKYAFRATKQIKDWVIGNKEVIDGWNEAVQLRRQGEIPPRGWKSNHVNEKFDKLDSNLRKGVTKDALKTGLGLYLPVHGDRKSHVQVGMDVLTGINNGKDAYEYYKKYKAAEAAAIAGKRGLQYANVASEASNVASKAGFGSKILTKASPVLSVAGTGIAAYDTYNNIQKGDWLGVTSGVGDVLMSAAPLVATAFPPVAAGMAIAGAALWIGAKGWQHRKSIAKIATDPIGSAKEAWQDTKKAASNAGKAVADTTKKVWNKATSWF